MLVSLEGIDGCGKTTLSLRIAEEMGWVYFNRKSIPDGKSHIEIQMQKIAEIMWSDCREKDSELSNEFWIHMHALWYTLIQDFYNLEKMTSQNNVIVDGWYYKIWSNLMRQNHKLINIKNVFYNVIKPDYVIYLNPNSDYIPIIYEKIRHRLLPHELGSHQERFKGNWGKESFVLYQNDTKLFYEKLFDTNWKFVNIDSDNIDTNYSKIKEIIFKL